MSKQSKLNSAHNLLERGYKLQRHFSKTVKVPLREDEKHRLYSFREAQVKILIGTMLWPTKEPMKEWDEKLKRLVFIGFKTLNPAYEYSKHGKL